jgi:predicted transcriptional regulator
MSASSPIELAAEMVAAFVSNNSLPQGELPALIQAMHSAVARLAVGPESARGESARDLDPQVDHPGLLANDLRHYAVTWLGMA